MTVALTAWVITWYYYTKSYETWQNQVNRAAGLTMNFNGTTLAGWRLPTTVDGPWSYGSDGTTTGGWNITSSEMGNLYYTKLGNKGYYDLNGNPQPGWGLKNTGPFAHLVIYDYWSGTECSVDPDHAWLYNFYSVDQGNDGKGDWAFGYALAVRPGDVSAVPIQGAVWLLGSGLIRLIGIRRRFKN